MPPVQPPRTSHPLRRLATVSLLTWTMAGCAAPTPHALDKSAVETRAPQSASSQAQRAALRNEMAKAHMRQRIADEGFWEHTLDLPRSHPKFPALRTALADLFGSEDMLNWWIIATDVVANYPGVSVGDLYARLVNNGLMRLDDAQAGAYLRSRATVMARMSEAQCRQYHRGELPNREVWSVAATLNNQEIEQYYQLERTAFLADMRNAELRALPSPQDIQTVQAALQQHLPHTPRAAKTAPSPCKVLATWMTSFEHVDEAQRSTALTLLLGRMSPVSPDAATRPERSPHTAPASI